MGIKVYFKGFLSFNPDQLVSPFLNWRAAHNLPLCKSMLTNSVLRLAATVLHLEHARSARCVAITRQHAAQPLWLYQGELAHGAILQNS